MNDETPPTQCLNPRNDWGDVVESFRGQGKGGACVDDLPTQEALAQLQRFCLRSTVWRRPYAAGYVGANPETGFFSPLRLQIATELKRAVPGLLDGHHLSYWWSFACQHQRPGTDVHADQSDISLNFWITSDTANLEPGIGGLDVWDIAAPVDWTFEDFNAGSRDIRAFLRHEGARQTSFACAENRALRAALRMTEGIPSRVPHQTVTLWAGARL